MTYELDDVQAQIKLAIKHMKMALDISHKLNDGDLKDTPDVIWDLSMFEFLLHEDLDEYAAFNNILEDKLADHGL
jgi:hypothetical protein